MSQPSNLLVNANCDLTICDFGLARGVDGEYEVSVLRVYSVAFRELYTLPGQLFAHFAGRPFFVSLTCACNLAHLLWLWLCRAVWRV